MDKNELWLSFIKSGSVKDYLSYIEAEREVKPLDANTNGCTCDKGNEHRG